jgi:hypothetical protein
MKKADWWSLGYAVAEGSSTALGIERDDIDVTIRSSQEGGCSVFLLDAVPGGAGHVVRIDEHLGLVLRKALERVANCGCEETTSCYECLRTFGNQRMHAQLVRGAAKRFLERAIGVQSPGAPALTSTDALRLIREEDLRETVRNLVGLGITLPEIAFEVVDELGQVVGELDVAWPGHSVGVASDDSVWTKVPGWQVLSSGMVSRSPEILERALLGTPIAHDSGSAAVNSPDQI